ncbi:hypothetical protein Ciccas_008603 [Cichlidogyrus casuarinus]|uniref:Partner of Y14 and mago n=1 Tax=Cichlidogyrus casuarinus TaxID=1844966 RepID=A0ABD2Q3R4_9PLAT
MAERKGIIKGEDGMIVIYMLTTILRTFLHSCNTETRWYMAQANTTSAAVNSRRNQKEFVIPGLSKEMAEKLSVKPKKKPEDIRPKPKPVTNPNPESKAPAPPANEATDLTHKLKVERKRLRQIEDIEKKKEQGSQLNKDQIAKLERKTEILQLIKQLERQSL